jgi:DNA-binding MarR family transcriptional regulator
VASAKTSTAKHSAELHSPTLARAADKLGDDPALPFMLASGAIMQAYRVMSIRVTEVLATVEDLSMPRYEVLGLLALSDDGVLAVRDIKRASLLHPPTLTYILDWLEKQGHVTRRPDLDDRRSVLIHLTAKGRRTFHRAQDALREIQFGLPGLEPEDALAVARALDITGDQ